MGILEIFFVLLVAATGVLAAIGLSGLWQRGQQPATSPEMASRLGGLMGAEPAPTVLEQVVVPPRWPSVQSVVRRVQPWRRLDDYVRSCGKRVTAVELAVLSAAAVVAGVATAQVFPGSALPLLLALVLGVAPWWRVAQLRSERIRKFEEQFPEALDLLGRAMRAGHSFPSAVRMCGDETLAPLGPELRQFGDELNYGLSFNDAVNRLTARVPVEEVSYFAVAVVIQRESGGNLVEILDKISTLVRQRMKLAGDIRVATAQGRMSASIMLALPPLFCLAVYQINPTLVSFLWTDPAGKVIAGCAAVLLCLGALWVRQVVQIRL